MQSPSMKTPVSKCLDLATHAIVMLAKFPQNPDLAALIPKLTSAAHGLDTTQTLYLSAVKAILPARVEVKYQNFVSDRRVAQTQKKAQIAGKTILAAVFPDGSQKITRLVGASQVDAMIALEGRLAAAATLWPDAAAEQQDIAAFRKGYAAAIAARATAGQDAAAVRATRDVAKRTFLAVYAEVQARVAAAFPLDTTMQDLFFDDLHTSSSAAQADASEEPAPADPAAPASPASPSPA